MRARVTGDVSIKAAQEALFAAVAAARRPLPPRGRPRNPASERTREPWRAEGVSQRTYYRRKARAGAVAPPVPPEVQQSAHVAAWYAQLGAIARLEHRAFVRRCLLARGRG